MSEPKRWAILRRFLAGESADQTYAKVGEALGMSEAAVKMRITRMRQRFRELLHDEIAQTVLNDTEIEEEYRALINAMRS